jgi:guanylate kinase
MTARGEQQIDGRAGLLVVVSGPSGAGKTTIARAIEQGIPGAVFSVSMTTRKKAAKDTEGVDYFFVDDDAFERVKAEDGFLEWADVFGRKYGTPRAWVEERLAEGRLVILEIDVAGGRQVKEKMPGMLGIFVLPPSEEALLERLRQRGRDSEEAIQRRFAEAKREMAEARVCGAYDVFVTNDDLESAVNGAIAAVKERLASV